MTYLGIRAVASRLWCRAPASAAVPRYRTFRTALRVVWEFGAMSSFIDAGYMRTLCLLFKLHAGILRVRDDDWAVSFFRFGAILHHLLVHLYSIHPTILSDAHHVLHTRSFFIALRVTVYFCCNDRAGRNLTWRQHAGRPLHALRAEEYKTSAGLSPFYALYAVCHHSSPRRVRHCWVLLSFLNGIDFVCAAVSYAAWHCASTWTGGMRRALAYGAASRNSSLKQNACASWLRQTRCCSTLAGSAVCLCLVANLRLWPACYFCRRRGQLFFRWFGLRWLERRVLYRRPGLKPGDVGLSTGRTFKRLLLAPYPFLQR